VSVVIPTYNRAGYLGSSIDSVLNQDFDHSLFEVIVIDDGSTDNTQDVIKKYGDKVRYYEIPHSGKPAVVRNYGIKKAKGEIIAFQDSDDTWAKDKLKNQYKVFESDSVVLSYGQAGTIDEKGKKINDLIVDKNSLSKGENFTSLLKSNVVSTLTVMVRKSVIEEVGFFNEDDSCRAVEDYELWLKILSKYPKGIKCLNKTLAHYRKHDSNISNVGGIKALNGILAVYKELWGCKLSSEQRNDLQEHIREINENHIRLSKQDKITTKPMISVVMGVYNGEDYVSDAIESILSQTYKNFEFIIINDGSTDETTKIVGDYARLDSRIKVISQPNRGLAESLNIGIDFAKGDYIARQDADDISLPSRLEKEIQVIASDNTISLVGSFFTYFNENSLKLSTTIVQPFRPIDLRRSVTLNNPFGHGTVLMKKSIFEKHKAYTGKLGPIEDYELWSRIASSEKFGMVPEVLYLYRLNSQGLSSLGNKEQNKQLGILKNSRWEENYIYKDYASIVADGFYYRSLNSPYVEKIYSTYLSQTYEIAVECLNRGWLKWGVINALALIRLDKSSFNKIRRKIVVSFFRKIKAKIKVKS